MNMQQWLNEYQANPIKKAMPVLSFPGVQLLGCSVKDVVTNGVVQADCMKAIAERYPNMAAALGPMDLSVEAEAFGAQVHLCETEVPTVVGAVLDIDDPDTAEQLAIPTVGSGRTGEYIKAVSLAKEKITDRPVFSGCIGPFSLAGRLMEMSNAMIACVEEPEMLETVLDKATTFLIAYIKVLKEAGADGIVMAEPAAGLLSPVLNEEFSVPYVKQIVDAVKDESFVFCYHNCGPYTPRLVGDLLTVGADIYHFGDAIGLEEVRDQIPGNVMFSGNVSPVSCFKTGDSQTMADQTRNVLNSCGNLPNFIPSSGCDIPPDASLENADVFFATVEAFYHGR
ncbi:MAG: uroporphyrinogen decarboxylase family protein [Clostridia bacterium]|nr:uroporphyrinogen decarboxylase family protein [Clostridia bacterium]